MTEETSDKAALRELQDKVRDIDAAFPKDELGNPDYSAHRKFHKDQTSAQENFEASRRKIISNITSWAAIGIITVLGSALVQYLMQIPKP